jgi:methylthioribose-1-phosphate isomerase
VTAADSDQPAGPGAGRPPGADQGVADQGRRRFFRQLAGDMLSTAATVVNAAGGLQRDSAAAAATLLDPAGTAASAGPRAAGVSALGTGGSGIAAGTAGATFRTPFRSGDDDASLLVIDQRRLPDEVVEIEIRGAGDATAAIRDMVVRGAPAIGQVAAIGLALAAAAATDSRPNVRQGIIRGAANSLISARPTAVNLRWAVERLLQRYEAFGELSEDGPGIAAALRAEADQIVFETTTDHGRLADFGMAALPAPVGRPLRVLTHCNTGPLACGQYGTALGIIQAAHHAGRELHVWVDETRPYLQGARLTTWELAQAGVPHALIPDVAAGHFISRGEVDAILVGADRVAANGDTANKVGTLTLAVVAARYGVPFLVCAPLSSVDMETADGSRIPIEERSSREVTELRGIRIAPAGTVARNPAFDVTPAELVSAIVTEEGVLTAPFEPALRAAFRRREARWAAMPRFEAAGASASEPSPAVASAPDPAAPGGDA